MDEGCNAEVVWSMNIFDIGDRFLAVEALEQWNEIRFPKVGDKWKQVYSSIDDCIFLSSEVTGINLKSNLIHIGSDRTLDLDYFMGHYDLEDDIIVEDQGYSSGYLSRGGGLREVGGLFSIYICWSEV